MEFKPLSVKAKSLLNSRELTVVNDLINKGNILLSELAGDLSFNRLEKLIKGYVNFFKINYELINSLIDRVLTQAPSLSVNINQLVINVQELIGILNKARVIDDFHKKIMSQLRSFLADFKVFVKIDFSVHYTLGRTKPGKHKLVLGFNDLTIDRFVDLLLHQFKSDIESGFMLTDRMIVESGVVNDFINGINVEELKLAIQEDPKHASFLMKAYVMLDNQVKGVNHLVSLMLDNVVVNDESSLDVSIALINQGLTKVSSSLVQALGILRKARSRGVVTQRLVSVYNETELINDCDVFLKSFLRSKLKVNDLLNQLLYDFLVIYDSVPSYLNYSFRDRSKYLFIKRFF